MSLLGVAIGVTSSLMGNPIRDAFACTHRGRIDVQLDEGCLVIEDTGTSVNADDLGQVFQRGFRGKDTREAGWA